jgi:hypothetical protein
MFMHTSTGQSNSDHALLPHGLPESGGKPIPGVLRHVRTTNPCSPRELSCSVVYQAIEHAAAAFNEKP